jgi:ATP-dependent DNA helicase RecG
MRLSDDELENLLRGGENFRVERKESLAGDSRNAIAEAICAFANDLAGIGEAGVIFVGVKDGKIEASAFVPDENALQTLVGMKTDGRITPPPSLLVETRTVAGLRLAVVTTLPSISPPVRFNGRIHIRVGARRGVATAQDERILNERRRHLDQPFDARPMIGLAVNTLNLRLFEEEYLPSAFDPEVLAENGRSIEQRLAVTKMIAAADNATPTALGIMVLGRSPLDYLSNFYVQFLRIDGVELTDPIIDEAKIDGTLAEILRRTDEKLRASIGVQIDLLGQDQEVKQATYPLPALQQLVRNAIMHRTYEATNAPVRITWFNDRIEIQNPGGPFGQVTRDNFGAAGVTDYRNPNIADAMKVLGYVQRFGVGIASARKLLAEAGHPAPEFIVEDNHVLVIVRGRQA